MEDKRRIEILQANLDIAADALLVARKYLAPIGTPGSVAWSDQWVIDYTAAVKTMMKKVDDLIYYVLEKQERDAPDQNLKRDVTLRWHVERLAASIGELQKVHQPEKETGEYK